uniref:Uncharacterized protein n=1 Tax=Magallana gigas TaxID=29159 RepID=A0A8W8MKW0_MAGGI
MVMIREAGVAGVTGMDGLDGVAGVTGMDDMEWLDGVDGMNGMTGLDGMAGVTGLEITITEDTVPGAGEDTNKDKTSTEEAKNTTAEIKNWKYNLLFYGLPKVDKEDTTEVVLNCLESTLGVSGAKDIIIQNSHRIPKNPSNTYKPSAPEAIIVKFAKMADRNLILHLARVTTLPKGMAIRTDLVNHLEKKRSELASKAYKLRREKNWKTRNIETKDDVILQCRRKSEDKWIPYQG